MEKSNEAELTPLGRLASSWLFLAEAVTKGTPTSPSIGLQPNEVLSLVLVSTLWRDELVDKLDVDAWVLMVCSLGISSKVLYLAEVFWWMNRGEAGMVWASLNPNGGYDSR